ncbi:protein EPD1 precursor [Aspergillus japonicus CBS 114.51]|uniref:1,3-beta-glucanosyltransferase n=2 Tax=Aspergillus TaxID=5052 RepID=A0A2V5HLM3_ASPV1|nr:protein EPD1 precursor [Aspergillus japonicus CBS 114.51]PYI23462.1 protein EPD1 precursor [Aspergillus violaceofuscus CBS 115571]RAH84292.1 protein EPD1 precursor [Aspergillus japonicus CBS 114.51]
MKLSLALGAAAFAGSALADIDPIVIKGSKFFYSSNNTQFYIRGVAYQADYDSNSTDSSSTSYVDPLADATTCKRDIPYLQEIRTNVIRTYAIDPTNNHTECMNMLADAGIYVITDMSDPSQSIDRDDPTWETSLFARYKEVIDDMSQFNNTLGFFAGNEVSNTIDTTDASAFVKAAVRDSKAYIKEKGYRSMGVGYATNDDADIRVNLADYFNCESEDVGVDFWGYNIYSWCGNSTYEESGYEARTEQFKNYSVPVFFSEYGCNTNGVREFTEIKALYGDEMNSVWSGGIVYMYFQTSNDYGLVSAIDSTSVSTMADFKYYSSEIQSATPSGVDKASYTPTNTALQSCPTIGTSWEAKASPLPPSPNSALCSCMDAAAGCVVKDSLSSTKYAALFSEVCGYISCTGVFHNGTTGTYGDYSMCEAKQQLNWALNRYWESQDKEDSACSFAGSATTTAASTASTCSSILSQAGTAGTGSVSATLTATDGSSSSTSTSTSDSSSSAGHMTGASMVAVGSLQLGAYVVTAIGAGLAMIML